MSSQPQQEVRVFLTALALSASVGGCGPAVEPQLPESPLPSSSPVVRENPTPTPSFVEEIVAPSPALTPTPPETATPWPTFTPTPTETATLTPTETITSTPTETPTLTPEPTATIERALLLKEWGFSPLIEMPSGELTKILENSEFGVDEPEPFPWVNHVSFWENQISSEDLTLGVAYSTHEGVRFPLHIIGEFQGWLKEPLKIEKIGSSTLYWLGAKFKVSEAGQTLVVAMGYSEGPVVFYTTSLGVYSEAERKLIRIAVFNKDDLTRGPLKPEEIAKIFKPGLRCFLYQKSVGKGSGAEGVNIPEGKVLFSGSVYLLGFNNPEEVEQIIGRPTGFRRY